MKQNPNLLDYVTKAPTNVLEMNICRKTVVLHRIPPIFVLTVSGAKDRRGRPHC